jgi:ATP-dependent helicase/nuclease subunit A
VGFDHAAAKRVLRRPGARDRERTVFSVGDPKQSIYAFQGADPERFLERSAEPVSTRVHTAEKKFTAPDLRTSFRSSPEILRAVDETMKGKPLIAGLGAHDEIVHLAARAEESLASSKCGRGRPSPSWPTPSRGMRRWTWSGKAARMSSTRQTHRQARQSDDRSARRRVGEGCAPMRAGDVLALVRKRGAMFRELIKAFKREKLPVAGADRMVLRDELAVQDCLALMQVALDPADDLSLACVLKGPWCNLTSDDKISSRSHYGRGSASASLSACLRARMQNTASHARSWRTHVARRGADAFAIF